jgi:hypothetical protein
MGVKLSQVLGETRTVSIDLGGDEAFTVTFRPGAVTPASLARAVAAGEAAEDAHTSQLRAIELMTSFLGDVLTNWNLTDEAGVPLPTTRESLEQLPVEALARVFAAINSIEDPELGKAPSTSDAG